MSLQQFVGNCLFVGRCPLVGLRGTARVSKVTTDVIQLASTTDGGTQQATMRCPYRLRAWCGQHTALVSRPRQASRTRRRARGTTSCSPTRTTSASSLTMCALTASVVIPHHVTISILLTTRDYDGSGTTQFYSDDSR